MLWKRINTPVAPAVLALAAAGYMTLVLNVQFWRKVGAAVDPKTLTDWGFVGAIALGVLLAYYLILILFAAPYTLKAVLAVLLPVTAGASYVLTEYGLPISPELIVTAFETDRAEVRDLITPKLAGYVLILGLVPAALLMRQTIAWDTFGSRTPRLLKSAAASIATIGLAGLTFSSSFTSVFREHRHLVQFLTPYNVVASTRTALAQRLPGTVHALAPFGRDVTVNGTIARKGTRSLTVLVVGETARAQNFSLNGYGRETNPGLAKVPDLINFTRVESCGTLTADSLPCMFSGVGRAGAYRDIALKQENLLDILARAGIAVTWLDNQSGCKGICARVASENLAAKTDAEFCGTGECHDEILLAGLAGKTAGLSGHAVVVLHMMGSHGPAYAKRYPKTFEAFTPVCETSQFSRCSVEQIVNAYDNTIRYSDHVLTRLIGILGDADRTGIATSMLYVSDHGESLGEKNLYLHGVPFLFAPKEQTHVPMVLWLSETFKREFGIDPACVAARSGEPLRHDHYFHSVLGLLDISTKVRDDALNIFRNCRRD